jgi:hypothetical protein
VPLLLWLQVQLGLQAWLQPWCQGGAVPQEAPARRRDMHRLRLLPRLCQCQLVWLVTVHQHRQVVLLCSTQPALAAAAAVQRSPAAGAPCLGRPHGAGPAPSSVQQTGVGLGGLAGAAACWTRQACSPSLAAAARVKAQQAAAAARQGTCGKTLQRYPRCPWVHHLLHCRWG